jgi:hypothetical protein
VTPMTISWIVFACVFAGTLLGIVLRHILPQHPYTQTLQIGMEVGQKRSLLLEEARSSIPALFLVVLVFWLVLIFTSFGLYTLQTLR